MTKTYEVSSDAVFRELEGEAVILDLASGTYYGLNEVGTRIWALLAAGRDEAAIAGALHEEFDVSLGGARADVAALASELLSRGLIRERDG